MVEWFQKHWTDLKTGRIIEGASPHQIIEDLKGEPVKGQWYRGATPPGYPSSMSAMELENRWHHQGVSEKRVRLPLPDWLVKNEDYIRKKSMSDALWTWRGDPDIPVEVWQDAQKLLSTPSLMDSMDALGHFRSDGRLLPQHERHKKWRQVCLGKIIAIGERGAALDEFWGV